MDGKYVTPIPEEGSYKDNIYDFPLTPPAAMLLMHSKYQQQRLLYKVNGQTYIKTNDHAYYSKPDYLPGFPGSFVVDYKTPKQSGGGLRPRWKTQDGFILEWDSEKGEVEKYTSNGKKHLGGFDPVTGEQTSAAVKGRNIKKYL